MMQCRSCASALEKMEGPDELAALRAEVIRLLLTNDTQRIIAAVEALS